MSEGIPKAANGRFERPTEITRPERSAVLLIQKANDIRRIVNEMRASDDEPEHWSMKRMPNIREAIGGLPLTAIIESVNISTEELIRERPAFYLALLERIDELTETPEGDG